MSSSAVSSGSKASLEGSIEGLSDLLECSVCLEPLGLAHKVLPCQHTFCTSCLEDLEAKQKKKNGDDPPGSPLFICPECRAEVRTPISALPSNVILNRILSGIHSNTPTSSPKNSPLDSLKLKTEHSVELKSHVQKKTSVNPLPLAIGDHRKLPLPIHSAPIRFDNNNIPGNWQTNPFLSPTSPPESPLPVLPPKMAPMVTPPPLPARPFPQSATPHQLYRALYDYKPVKPDELFLRKDELYFVIEKCQDGWFKGSSITSLKTGVFPGNYVQHVHENQLKKRTKSSSDLIDFSSDIMDVFAIPPPSTPMTSSKAKKIVPAEEANSSASGHKQNSSKSATSGGRNSSAGNDVKENVIFYRATMPFPASSPYELELKMGDVITMNKIREDGWCKGTLQRSGQTGLFPLSFVEKIS